MVAQIKRLLTYYAALYNHDSCVFFSITRWPCFSSFEIHTFTKYTTSWPSCCVKTSLLENLGSAFSLAHPAQFVPIGRPGIRVTTFGRFIR
jgi:hypothetical protein